jgi:dihydroflavonol-4-reductase
MKCLVTGANGLLGHHVVIELLRRNHSVRIIVRSTKSIYFDLKSIEVFIGQFTDYENLKQAADRCDAIIHIAAVTRTDLLLYEDYQQINVIGANQIVQVANELNIKNIVFVSSSNTIGYGKLNQLADETFPVEFPFSQSYYTRSKVEAEEIFFEASKQTDMHVIIINPTFMIGAFDTKPSSGKLMLMGYKKRIMFIPKGGKNFVPVSDVSATVCNALTQGRNGEKYLASGTNLSFREFYSNQKHIGNYRQVLISIPDFLLIIIGIIGDLIRKLNIKTEICSMNLRQLIITEFYTNQKAKNELNLLESDLKIATKEAIEWFKDHKMI